MSIEKDSNNFKKKVLVLLLGIFAFTFVSLMILNPGENFSEVVNIQEFTQTILGLVIVNSQPSEDVIDFSNVTVRPEFSHLNISNISHAYDVTDAYQGLAIVSYWSFDVDNGTAAYDYGDYQNDGTINSDPLRLDGVYQNAYHFDGSDDYIQQESKLVDSYPFTYSAWVKTRDTDGGAIIGMYDASAANVWYYMGTLGAGNGSAFLGARNTASELTSGGNITDGEWHHVVAVFASDTDKRIYVDGDNQGNLTTSVTFNANVDRWAISRRADSSPDFYLNATIDDVAVYGIALNESEVLQLFNNQSVRFVPNGIQTFRAFNVTVDENRVNISQTFSNFSSYISSRIAQINMSVSPSNGSLLYHPIEYPNGWDYTSNENDINLQEGAPTYSATGGVNGTGGVSFDGIDDAYGISGSALDFERDQNFSISVWVNISSTSGFDHIIGTQENSAPFRGWTLQVNNSENRNVRFALGNDNSPLNFATEVSTIDLDDNLWHHIAVTYNGSSNASEIEIYIDGVSSPSYSLTDVLSATIVGTEDFYVGARGGVGIPFNGSVDELSIWDRVLTPSEIDALYNDTAKSFNKIYYSDYQNGSSGENLTFITSSEFVFAELYYSSGDFGFYSPTLEQNLTVGSFFTPGDSCTVPGSGSWEITCSDNCTLSTEANLEGNLSLIGGNGTFDITGNLTFTNAGSYIFLDTPACQINIHSGSTIG